MNAPALGEGAASVAVSEVVLVLQRGANRAAHARAFVRGALVSWQVADAAAQDVEQVVSELVADAFDRAAPEVEVRLELRGRSVQVTVSADGAGAAPAQDATSPGLFVVGRLAAEWDVVHEGGRLRLRALVALDPADPA